MLTLNNGPLQLYPEEQHSMIAKALEIVISPTRQLRQSSLMNILKPHQLSSESVEADGIDKGHLKMAKPIASEVSSVPCY